MCVYTEFFECRAAPNLTTDLFVNVEYTKFRITEAFKPFLLHAPLRDLLARCIEILIYIP